ncbi:MAG: putative DNA-binding domain-containing protein [Holophagaceae bacterium]|nr:putative DNA-binding domain-containing protein [Holophagaceae bacterium]
MAEQTAPTRDLLRCMADLILDADGAESFTADPRSFGAARGLGQADQSALETFKARLLTYRDLARNALEDPLPDCFPILHALLGEADEWDQCLDAFLASRTIQSPYYRDVSPAFVGWLADSGWGLERWPFLLQLAHFEYIEVEILRWPDEAPEGDLQDAPTADSCVVFDGAARNLAYAYRVHEATKETPEPPEGEAFLMGYRDADGDFGYSELSPHASAFLARCLDGESVREAASTTGLEVDEVLDLLNSLRRKGAISGFR